MTEKRGSTKGSTTVRRSTTGVRQKRQFVEPFTNPFTNLFLSTKYNKKEGVRHKIYNVTKKAEKQTTTETYLISLMLAITQRTIRTISFAAYARAKKGLLLNVR